MYIIQFAMVESDARRILLYKRMQRIPLRSTLNIALFDMRKLEYDIRRTVHTSDRLASVNLLKDVCVEELMTGKRSEVFAEMIPKAHRRRSPLRRRVEKGKESDGDRRGLCTARGSFSPINTLRRSSDLISLQLKCRKAKSSVKFAKQAIDKTQRTVIKHLESCSEDVDKALRRSQNTFFPFQQAADSKSLSPTPIHKESFSQFRNRLRALSREKSPFS